jgi:hypothetical protein
MLFDEKPTNPYLFSLESFTKKMNKHNDSILRSCKGIDSFILSNKIV